MPPATAKEEFDLIQRIKAGDSSAFDTLYRRYHPSLWRFAHYFTESREVAEDVVQDVFVSLWERRSGLEIMHSVNVYLYTAVKHRALALLRHDRITHRLAQSEGLERVSGIAVDQGDASPSGRDGEDLIQHVLATMPPKRRQLLTLRWMDGLKYEQISEIMGMSLSAVKMQIKRAHEDLRPLMEKLLRD